MTDETFTFVASDGFEWDENKNEANLEKHGVDFDDASRVLHDPILLRRSDRDSEAR